MPMPPLTRAGRVTRDGSNVGLSRLALYRSPHNRSLNSSTRRYGHGTSPSRARELSHFHPARPAAAYAPATMKPRRVRRRRSLSTSASFAASSSSAVGSGGDTGSGSGAGAGTTGSSLMHHLHADDHCSEIVPAGLDHLPDMNEKENDVADGQPEVEEARHRVAAEHRGQPVHLHRLVDRQAGQQREEAHDHDHRVGDALRAVVLPLRRRLLAQAQVVEEYLPGIDE